MKLKLYIADVAALEDEAMFNKALCSIDDQRKNKISRVRYAKDKRLSLGAGTLLLHALQNEGLPRNSAIQHTENGKLFLPDYPQLHFNLSHSGIYVICAVAECEVGCDIQTQDSISLAIADRFYSAPEKQWLFSLPSEKQNEAFYRIWALKESFIKATGEGLKLPLTEFSIVPKNDELVFIPPAGYINKSFSFYESFAVPGCSCACCAAVPNGSLDFCLISEKLGDIINKIT